MVAMFEIVFLIVCVLLGLLWFRRTNLYRAHQRSGVDPGQSGSTASKGLPPHSGPGGGGFGG
jgi:hypothetical protein